MTGNDRERLADQLRPAVEARAVDRSLREIADEVGVSHATVSNFLGGKVPSKRTLAKIRQWLEAGDDEQIYQAHEHSTGYGTPAGSPAERLIHLLTHPEIVRRFSDHPPMDFVKAGFAYALEEDFSSEEMEKLEAWRRAVRGEGGGAEEA